MSAEDHPARDIAAKLGREARGFHFVVARVLREAAMVTDAEPDAVPTPKATVAAISDGSANLTVLREALPIRLKPSIDRAIQYIHAPSEAKSAASLIEVLGRGVKLSDAALALNYEVAEAQALFKELIPKPSAQAQADMLEVLRAMVPVMERVV